MVPLSSRSLIPSKVRAFISPSFYNARATIYTPAGAVSSPPRLDTFGQPVLDTGQGVTGAVILRENVPCRVYASNITRIREQKLSALTLDEAAVTILLRGNHTDILDSMQVEVTGYAGDVTLYDILMIDIDSEGMNTKLTVKFVRI